jgi:tetratricopeptide (TPR) repeat protein
VSAWIAAVGGRWEAVTQLAAPTASWVWPHNNRARLYYGGIVQWVLGEAYEQLSRPDSAIVYFERLVAPTAGKYSGRMYTVGFTYSFAQRRLAKLYAELGDDQRAEEHWLTFLETFTDPDPEYEWMVEEARAELQNLAIGR